MTERYSRTLAASLSIIGTLAGAAPAQAQGNAPDAIYVGGKIVTVDSGFSIAEAFAVSGDKFVAVGDAASVRKLAGSSTRVVDLKGRMVLPGFIDTHAHTIIKRIGEMYGVSLHGAHSVAEIARRVGDAAAEAAPGTWIVTTAMGETPDYFDLPASLTEKRWPTRQDLDKVAPRNPVYIPTTSKWPNPAIFNSAALGLLGITRDTADEPKTIIVKDGSGEPTGVIYGLQMFNYSSALFDKVKSLAPGAPQQLREEATKLSMRDNIAAGVTTIYEGHGSQPGQVRYLRTLAAAGELPNRVVVAYEAPVDSSLAEIETWMRGVSEAKGAGTGDGMLKVVGITASIDGATQQGAAYMSKDYLDPYGRVGNGKPHVDTAKLAAIARLAVKYDLRLNIVAAGDKSCAMAVEALEIVNRETPIKDKRWVVQHFQHPTPAQIARLKEMGLVATTYTSVDYSKGAETYVKQFPGQDMWQNVVPMRWWFDGGVTVAQSTDGAHYEPMFTLWESLVRLDGRTGKSLLTPSKTITREEAIRAYTINGARVVKWEDRLGSIEPGKLADFVVVDRDLLKIPVDQIRDAQVLLTALGGKIVHDKLSPTAEQPRPAK